MRFVLAAAVLRMSSVAASAHTTARYLVVFDEPAILELDPTALKLADGSTEPTPRAKALFGNAKTKQAQTLGLVSAKSGLKLNPLMRVLYTNNLVVLDLNDADAQLLRTQPGIASVERETAHTLQTDVGPSFVGATGLWQSTAEQTGSRGARVLVGIVDTGINASHPSFTGVSSDDYTFPAAFARRGLCTGSAAARCNNKLVGIFDFTTEGSRDGSDLDGHGTHVASIAAGNPFNGSINATTITHPVAISGVAPRAHLISYKACLRVENAPSTCPMSGLIAAIEQAALDGVKVLNYSIGSKMRSNPFAAVDSSPSDVRSMYNARAAGMVITVSAGNEGPTENTITSPAHAPWVIAVANISHDRVLRTQLANLSGTTAPPKLNFDGAGITAALGDRAVVLAERFGNRQCGQGDDSTLPPTGASNPFAPGTFNGEIVVCERGVQARVAKSFNLRLAGAGGMILVNTALEGESIVADDHYLPTVHLGQADGEALVTWLRQAGNSRGSITATQTVHQPELGDQLNPSSSVGPIGLDYLKPDIAAPGSNILAANLSSGLRSLTGTSMAAPHVAGSVALLRALHPNWAADEVESALRSSALGGQVRAGGVLAGIDKAGAGRLRVDQASRVRAYFPITAAAMKAASADPSSMNLPSLWTSTCRNRCTFRRVLRGSADLQESALFSMHVHGVPVGLEVVMRPAQFSLSANQSQTIDFDVEIKDSRLAGPALTGTLELRAAGQASLHLPLRVQVPNAVPKTMLFDVPDRRGQIHTTLSGLIALPRPSALLSQFGQINGEAVSLAVDNTLDDPFDAVGTRFRSVNVSVAEGFFWARLRGNLSGPVELYVGKDDDRSQSASVAEVRCKQIQSALEKICLLPLSGTGNYWVVARNLGQGVSTVSLESAVIGRPQGDNNVALMPGNVPENAVFGMSFSYDLQRAASPLGARHIAVLELRADAGALSPFSQSFVELRTVSANEKPAVLLREQSQFRSIAAGQSDSSIGFSLPSGTRSARISASGSAELELELYRAEPNEAKFVGITATSQILSRAHNLSGFIDLDLTAQDAAAGPYYLRLINRGTTDQAVALKLSFENASQAALAPELYYNPARSGHGMLVTRADDLVHLRSPGQSNLVLVLREWLLRCQSRRRDRTDYAPHLGWYACQCGCGGWSRRDHSNRHE